MARSALTQACSRAHRRGRARRVSGRACVGATRTRTSSPSSVPPPSGWGGRRRCASSRGDPDARVHPQTVIEHFGTWNAAKRAAGLFPRRFLTRDELLEQLRSARERAGRTPTARDLAARGRSMPSASLYAHTFGSLGNALREAGFEVLQGEERLERAVEQGATPRRDARPAPEDGGLGGGAAAPIRRCSRSGRSTGCWTSRVVPGRRSSTSFASVCARTASDRARPDGTLGGSWLTIDASAARRSEARTRPRAEPGPAEGRRPRGSGDQGGSDARGRPVPRRRGGGVPREPRRRRAACLQSRGGDRERTPGRSEVEAVGRSRPSQSGRRRPRARNSVVVVALVEPGRGHGAAHLGRARADRAADAP